MGDLSLSEGIGRTTDVIIQRNAGLFHLDLSAVWHYRELLYFLIWRDVKVRYKQTVIGAGWAILQPLMTMVIFTIVFGNFVKVPSDGLPYSIFAYTALLPWNFFAQALSRSGNSLVGSANLIKKVYFPRLIIPIAAAVGSIVDFAIAFVILLGMMTWFGIAPTWDLHTRTTFISCLSQMMPLVTPGPAYGLPSGKFRESGDCKGGCTGLDNRVDS